MIDTIVNCYVQTNVLYLTE